MRIINLTPHKITLINSDGDKKAINPSGKAARVDTKERWIDRANGIDFYVSDSGDVKDLPKPTHDIFYIVSKVVAAALPWRDDLFVPHGLIRDDKGNIIGSKGLTVANWEL